jgi:hypothetical protein
MVDPTSESLSLQVQLMVREAAMRLEDAEHLDSRATASSDSGYLLRLLAFEILLKASVVVSGKEFKRSHTYPDLWLQVPIEVRRKLVGTAERRMGATADYSDVTSVLDHWSNRFTDLRYPYEKYTELNRKDYEARSRAWIESGAAVAKADFAYFPTELYGLTYALDLHVSAWLDSEL